MTEVIVIYDNNQDILTHHNQKRDFMNYLDTNMHITITC